MKMLIPLLLFCTPVIADECISKDFGGVDYVVQCDDTVTIIRNERTVVCSKLISGNMSCVEVLK